VSALLRQPSGHTAQRAGSGYVPPAWTITAVLGFVYVIAAPPSTDLAAAAYRSNLFSRVGFTLWDNAWYGGHHLLAYSVLAPALGAWIGPQPLAALSMIAASALFVLLIEDSFPPRATRIAALWFAVGAAVSLLANRVPFDLGLALGFAALLSAQRDRRPLTLLLTILSSLASPVAGAFLALAFLAWAVGGRSHAWPLALVLTALAPVVLLVLAFPEGGTQPFVASAFYPALAGVLVIAALIPAELRVLRTGALLYAVALTGAYIIPTAVGGNADRLGALVGAPIVACLLLGGPMRDRPTFGQRPRLLLLLLAPLLFYWQANAPVADFVSAASDPAVHASYYTPLLGELRVLGVGYSARPARIEVVPTTDHWEARWMAPHIALARGWERQLDSDRGALFYTSAPLTATRYRAWLLDNAIAYVALPDAPLDYSAQAEARLLRGARSPSYLRETWRSAHWRLFAVLDPQPLAEAPATLTSLGSDSFTLSAPRAGAFVVRVRFSPYWALSGGRGCVREAPGGWTEVQVRHAGSMHVGIDFSLQRVFDHGPRCRLG